MIATVPTVNPTVNPRLPVHRRALAAEETATHTRILRLALGMHESRAYWAQVDPATPSPTRALLAFQQRWFGAKSLERVRLLLANFTARYDALPQALDVLRRWRDMDAHTRQVICHVHLQISDPIYRRFTGQFLVARRAQPHMSLTRDVVLRWFAAEYTDRWGAATRIQFASKLLSAASEAGLISLRKDPRQFLTPHVPNLALAYVLHLLRGLDFQGTLLDNPYLASLALTGPSLDARVRVLPGVQVARMGELVDVRWAAPDLSAWADQYLRQEQREDD